MVERLRKLLFTFSGRIGRGQFWLGVFCLFLATFALSTLAIAVGLGTTSLREGYTVIDGQRSEFSSFRAGPTPLASLLIAVLLLAPWLSIAIKRRHDRNSNGYDVVGVSALNLLIQLLAVLGVGGPLVVTLNVIALVWGVVLLILLGFLRGDAGDNTYGPDPLTLVPR